MSGILDDLFGKGIEGIGEAFSLNRGGLFGEFLRGAGEIAKMYATVTSAASGNPAAINQAVGMTGNLTGLEGKAGEQQASNSSPFMPAQQASLGKNLLGDDGLSIHRDLLRESGIDLDSLDTDRKSILIGFLRSKGMMNNGNQFTP